MNRIKGTTLLIAMGFAVGAFSASTITMANSENQSTKIYGDLVQAINNALIEGFVIPEVAPKYAARLNQCLRQDCLSSMQNEEEAAKKITELLQSVYQDKHLNIFAPGQREKMRERRMAKRKGVGKPVANSSGIAEVKVLDGNIGYFKIDMFPGTPESIAATHEAMKELKDTSAIIFDIRDHRGGSPQNITEISNFLFEKETHMVTTQSPHRNDGQPNPHFSSPNEYAASYKDKPAYLLTSKRSGSAAEHFAMAMKSTGRAILVGDTTGGWGHWGGIVPLKDGFSMFLPSGRTYHPVSQLGWEGFGITPDIMIDEKESLDYVLKRIKALM